MKIPESRPEKEIPIYDGLDFVTKQAVTAGEMPSKDNHAYRLKGPESHVVFITAGTVIAPEFRDANGDPLDSNTRILFQKCDPQGNPKGDFVVLSDLLGKFNYEKMRQDPDYMRKTKRDLMLDEREIAKIFLQIPEGAENFAPSKSRLEIGDTTSDFGQPVEIIDHDDLSTKESAVVKQASTVPQGGN